MLKKIAIVILLLGALALLVVGVIKLFAPVPPYSPLATPSSLPPAGGLPPAPTYTPPAATTSSPERLAQRLDFLRGRDWPINEKLALGTPQGTVEVKNPYLAMADSEEGNLILRDTPTYSLSYSTVDSSFSVKIYELPFETNRKIAEQDLLKILGVAPADACKLSVAVLDYANLDPQNYGSVRRLSACFGGGK
ncbi:MAG: hypothetical protein HY978_03770 [Candidatus Liptonbacteria bacterium]|nr:hypothetical protein [Candidatus Liptonbacteria bacterium]